MAKMFYTTEEAAAKMKISVDQLKQLVTESKLREFRDGAKVMFKVDQVDKIAGDKGATKAGTAAPGRGGSDSGIGLTPMDSGGGDAISLADTGTHAPTTKEDTVVTSAGSTAGGTKASVFEADEIKDVDTSAQTQIQPPAEDQLSLEGVGSGSGLLDLTRESDDTSLGAELLDEIYPGGDQKSEGVGSSSGIFETPSGMEQAASAASSTGSGLAVQTEAAEAAATSSIPMYEEAPDSSAGAFGGMALAAVLVMVATATAMGAWTMDLSPAWMDMVTGGWTQVGIAAGVMAVMALLLALVGFFAGKATSR